MTDSGYTVTVDAATVSVLTMLMTVVPNARVGGEAPTVIKTVSGAQVAVPLWQERNQHLHNWPSGCISHGIESLQERSSGKLSGDLLLRQGSCKCQRGQGHERAERCSKTHPVGRHGSG